MDEPTHTGRTPRQTRPDARRRHNGEQLAPQPFTSGRPFPSHQRTKALNERGLPLRLELGDIDPSSASLEHTRQPIERFEGGRQQFATLHLGNGALGHLRQPSQFVLRQTGRFALFS